MKSGEECDAATQRYYVGGSDFATRLSTEKKEKKTEEGLWDQDSALQILMTFLVSTGFKENSPVKSSSSFNYKYKFHPEILLSTWYYYKVTGSRRWLNYFWFKTLVELFLRL